MSKNGDGHSLPYLAWNAATFSPKSRVRGTKSGSVSVRPIIYKAQYLYSNITIPKYEVQSQGQCLSDQLSTKHNICTAISQYPSTRHKVRVSVCPTNYLQSTISVQQYHNTDQHDSSTSVTRLSYHYANICLKRDICSSRGKALFLLASCQIYAPKCASVNFVGSWCPFRCSFGCVLLLHQIF